MGLCVKCWGVQATEKALGTMVLQEQSQWVNFACLSDREKGDILDMHIYPEGIFGATFTSRP